MSSSAHETTATNFIELSSIAPKREGNDLDAQDDDGGGVLSPASTAAAALNTTASTAAPDRQNTDKFLSQARYEKGEGDDDGPPPFNAQPASFSNTHPTDFVEPSHSSAKTTTESDRVVHDDENHTTHVDESAEGVAAEDLLLFLNSSPSTTRTVQLAMTGLCVLFVPVVVLSVMAMERYRLVVIVCLVLLFGLFAGLILVIQHVTQNPTVFHPVLHRWAEAVATEYQDFVQDWRMQFLLLTYEPADMEGNDSNHESSGPEQNHMKQPPSQHRPKSRVFRAIVQPFVPWLTRRKQKRKERRDEKHRRRQNKQQQEQTPQELGDAYVPPDYKLV